MLYDVVIAGGGPAGLSAALALGRARKRVLLCDFVGPRRNAAAHSIHNYVTRDGTSPDEFRHIGRQQLATYPNVETRDVRVASITGTRGAFRVELSSESVDARRIMLCMGMVDEMLALEGLQELWGRAIFQCPYCHGWENQDRRWGYFARAADSLHFLPFSLQLRGWTRDVVVFTGGSFEVAHEASVQLQAAGIRLETSPVTRLFVHPPQRQTELVRALGVALDADGYIQLDARTRETSTPGIYAAGDLTTRMQAAIAAASSGTQTAAMLNLELTIELATRP